MTQKTIFCVISTTDSGPELHEFETDRKRLEWLCEQDDSFEDFYSFEVKGTIDGLTIPNVGEHAKKDLQELEVDPVPDGTPETFETPGLGWLVLPDESKRLCTNFGDARDGDASELVAMVNDDPALNQGHTDWRLPTVLELKGLIRKQKGPKWDQYWTCSGEGSGKPYMWAVQSFNVSSHRLLKSHRLAVRLVRSI